MLRFFLILLFIPFFIFGQENIKYIENLGQWDESSLYKADLLNGVAFFKQNSVRFSFYDSEKINTLHTNLSSSGLTNVDFFSYDFSFLNSNSLSKLVKEISFDGYYNFFIGSDKRKWKNNVKAFKSVKYSSIYEFILLIYTLIEWVKDVSSSGK